MKKTLSVILRIVFAAAGIAYIAYSLNWQDGVIFPADYAWPDQVSRGEVELRVLSRDGDRIELASPDADGLLAIHLTVDQLGEQADQPRFHPGIFTTLRTANTSWLLLGLLLVGTIYPIQMVRWLMLLRCRGIDCRPGKCFALTMVGVFFNFCLPGTTGGDLVKAYYAAKNSDRRGTAIMSVIFDRVTGLFGLVIFAGLASLFMLRDPLGIHIAVYVWLVFAATVLASAVYFSRRIRVWLGLQKLIDLLPSESLLAKIDRVAHAYTEHKLTVTWAVLLSLPVQLVLSLGAALAGYAMGMSTPLVMIMTVLPLLFLAGAVPLTYQGLGIMEGLAIALILPTGTATANQIVGMLMMIRLYQVFYGLLGSLYLLRGDIHLHPPIEHEAATVADSADTDEPAGRPVLDH